MTERTNVDEVLGEEPHLQLVNHFFTPLRGSRGQRHFGDVVCHRDAHAAKQLDPFCNGVDKLALLLLMPVEQHVKLVELGPATCQWCFL